jgi:hypothetical protein
MIKAAVFPAETNVPDSFPICACRLTALTQVSIFAEHLGNTADLIVYEIWQLVDCASQPENPPPFCGVIDRMLDEFETEVRQQGLIFGRIEACMVQRISPIRAHCLAMTKAGIEHQNSGWRRR